MRFSDTTSVTMPMVVRALYWKMRSSARCMAPRFTPDRWWECDVLVVTGNSILVEYEIKLTRKDFKADGEKGRVSGWRDCDPKFNGGCIHKRDWETKHGLLKARSPEGPNRFYFVVPEGLVTRWEVPTWAGLIYVRPTKKSAWLIRETAAPLLHRDTSRADAITQRIKDAVYHRFWQKWCGEFQMDAEPQPAEETAESEELDLSP